MDVRLYQLWMHTEHSYCTLNAVKWQVDPSRIGIMGFSAGGHVAATTGMHFDFGNPDAVDIVDRASC
jgi:acetyl esterase/lipase